MSLEVGAEVVSATYGQKGIGKIIKKTDVFGETYCELLFVRTKEIKQVPLSDLRPLREPIDLIFSGKACPTHEFLLVLINKQIQSYLTQKGLLAVENFKIIPLPHQILAVNFLVEQFKPRCLFADEVGLGKTIEAALAYEELTLRNMVKRVLVIAPAGLTRQWRDEFLFKFGEEFQIFDSQTFKVLKSLHGESSNPWMLYDRVITSMDFVKPRKVDAKMSLRERERREQHNHQVFQGIVQANWDIVIIDEAHKLSKKEHTGETARFKLGSTLAESVPIFLLLTATPHQGDSEKFMHLLSLIDPHRFYGPEQLTPENVKQVTVRNRKRAAIDFQRHVLFKQRITSIKEIERTTEESQIEIELYNAITEYVTKYYKIAERENNRAFIFLLMLYQRMVSSSSKAIHDSLQKRLDTLRTLLKNSELNQEEVEIQDIDEMDSQTLFEEISSKTILPRELSDVKAEIAILERCLSIALRAWKGRSDEKVKPVIEIINEVIKRENNPSTKFLIFTEFISTQKYVGNILEVYGYKVAYINGKMAQNERILEKKKFSRDHQIMISTDAGGEGINLQFCHVVINYDLPWNPMKIEQRIGRVDRIGQQCDVLVFNLILKDTIEQHVRKILERKLLLIAEEFGEDKMNDILTALHDDFDFDKIFVDALAQKQTETGELERLSEEIYQRAKQILEKDEILLPFTSVDVEDIEARIVDSPTRKIRLFVEAFLKTHGLELAEYRKRPGVYYFQCPAILQGLPRQFKDVVFDRSLAVNDESLELLGIKNRFIRAAMRRVETTQFETQTGSLKVESTGHATDGLLACFEIHFQNSLGHHKLYVQPIFIDDKGCYLEDVSSLFEHPESLQISTVTPALDKEKYRELLKCAWQQIEVIMYNTFQKEKLDVIRKLEKQKEKLMRYYTDKEAAISKIAIDNIRESKRRELREQQSKELKELRIGRDLIPTIRLVQLAVVKLR